mmetsp:Transcript_55198/g.124328  ORF Transcript_55198/g.124328 Transcript_55198/m.124328 type:complete len:230 (-) Transcript_55198:152-841(-)
METVRPEAIRLHRLLHWVFDPPGALCGGVGHSSLEADYVLDRAAWPLCWSIHRRWRAAALHLRSTHIHGRERLHAEAGSLLHLRSWILQRSSCGIRHGTAHPQHPVRQQLLQQAARGPSLRARAHAEEGCPGCCAGRLDARAFGYSNLDRGVVLHPLPPFPAGWHVPPAQDSNLRAAQQNSTGPYSRTPSGGYRRRPVEVTVGPTRAGFLGARQHRFRTKLEPVPCSVC